MTKDQLVFAIDWFESAIERDKEHNQTLCLDCQANKIVLEVLKERLEFTKVCQGIEYANRDN